MKSKKAPTSSMGPNAIRVSQGAYQKAILKSVFGNLILAVIALVVIYLSFAATVSRVVYSSAGFVPLKNNTYAGGVLPPKSQALVVLGGNKVGEKVADRLKQSFIPQKPSALVSIAAGPVAQEVKWTGSILTVDGKAMPAPVAQDPGLEFLSGQYVAVCIEGDCTPGTLMFFKDDQVLGIPFAQDAAVPAAPSLNTKANGPDRSNPEEVVRAFIIEAYNGNTELSCSLIEPGYFKNVYGTVKKCQKELSFINTRLDRDFDFGSNFLTKVTSDDGMNATVEYNLVANDVDLGAVEIGLVKTKKGWVINSEKDK